MILLDTNVVSEPLRPAADPRVLAWIDAQSIETLYLSAITVAELRFGLVTLPVGRRHDTLHRRLETEVLPLFEHRVLPFDLNAAAAYADLMARAGGRPGDRQGRRLHRRDGRHARSQGRHPRHEPVRSCGAAGLRIVDPWAAA